MKPMFDSTIPIYLQIMEVIKIDIVAGIRKPGDKMESVRDLAQQFGVNPNTMQRALSELEREKLIYTERTAGRFITADTKLIMQIRDTLAEEEMKRFLNYMRKIGYTDEAIIAYIIKQKKEGKQNG